MSDQPQPETHAGWNNSTDRKNHVADRTDSTGELSVKTFPGNVPSVQGNPSAGANIPPGQGLSEG